MKKSEWCLLGGVLLFCMWLGCMMTGQFRDDKNPPIKKQSSANLPPCEKGFLSEHYDIYNIYAHTTYGFVRGLEKLSINKDSIFCVLVNPGSYGSIVSYDVIVKK